MSGIKIEKALTYYEKVQTIKTSCTLLNQDAYRTWETKNIKIWERKDNLCLFYLTGSTHSKLNMPLPKIYFFSFSLHMRQKRRKHIKQKKLKK